MKKTENRNQSLIMHDPTAQDVGDRGKRSTEQKLHEAQAEADKHNQLVMEQFKDDSIFGGFAGFEIERSLKKSKK